MGLQGLVTNYIPVISETGVICLEGVVFCKVIFQSLILPLFYRHICSSHAADKTSVSDVLLSQKPYL